MRQAERAGPLLRQVGMGQLDMGQVGMGQVGMWQVGMCQMGMATAGMGSASASWRGRLRVRTPSCARWARR